MRREDFERFDLVVAMDAQNRRDLLRMAGPYGAKVRLLREFDPVAPPGAEVPDPYYDGPARFTEIAEMIEAAVAGMLNEASAARDLSEHGGDAAP